MRLPDSIRQTLDNLPEQPGVYCFRDLQGQILYIGKSKNLSDRVSSYFRPTPSNRKMAHLKARTKSIDFLLLNTDHQAQEVEWDLIQHHRPDYNSVYLDYWNHPYLKLTTEEPYPRIDFTNKTDDDRAEYFGPFKSTRRLRMTITALQEAYPVRTCDLPIPPGGDPDRFESCYEYELGRCTAPCVGRESVDSYRDRLQAIRAFLKGDYGKVLDSLNQKMEAASANHNYESASIYRDRIEAVEDLISYEPFIRETLRADVWGTYEDTHVLLKVREHRLKDFTVVNGSGTEVRQKYYRRNHRPETVIIGGDESNAERSFHTAQQEREVDALVESAEQTARYHNPVCDGSNGCGGITDRVFFERNKLRVKRRGLGDEIEETIGPGKPAGLSLEKIMSRYQQDVEKGRFLPDRVIVSAESTLDLKDENLFVGRDFWFPILME